ncbi:MAG: putative ABC exporter domain-containing protein [Lachnospiraceae bacterium]
MNRSIFYLARKTIKNQLLQIKTHPAKAVPYLILVAVMLFSLLPSFFGEGASAESMGTLDSRWLKLGLFAYLMLFWTMSIAKGLEKGASFFDMADVNFLFVSPLNPKGILMYGLARELVRNVLAGFFILFMGAFLKSSFNISFPGLLLLLLFYVIAQLLMQIMAVVIYTYTNQRQTAKKLVIALALAVCVPLLVTIGTSYMSSGDIVAAALTGMQSEGLWFIPVAGWATEGVYALLFGGNTVFLTAVAALAAFVVVFLLLLFLGKTDYYEGVLIATETGFQKKEAAASGDLQKMTATDRKLKIRENAKIWGEGAKVLFGKHMIESTRSARFKIFDVSSLVIIITAILVALFSGDGGGGGTLLVIMAILMYVQLFMIGTGLGLKELYMHYIFMIPASSITKLLWSNMEVAIKSLCSYCIGFVAVGVILKSNPLHVLLCIVTSFCFVLVLLAVNLLSMRLFTNMINQGILVMLYMLSVILVMAPGVAGGVILAVVLSNAASIPAALLVLTGWELLASLICFYLARGILDTCDMEVMPNKMK